MNYYNDNDPKICDWLEYLVRKGFIPCGDVDRRSITDVEPSDLEGYAQCHFFAGIGGWSYAFQLAGWNPTIPVWTGSCPCQPLSGAGRRAGEKDERHLWPEFYRLISECRPGTIFGEQVASGDGPEWVDGISLDLEELGYAVAAVDLPAACVGSPQIRQRLFWVADTPSFRFNRLRKWKPRVQEGERGMCQSERDCSVYGVANAEMSERGSVRQEHAGRRIEEVGGPGGFDGVVNPQRDGRRSDESGREAQGRATVGRGSSTDGMGTANESGLERWDRMPECSGKQSLGVSSMEMFWSDYNIALCRNPKGGDPIQKRFKSVSQRMVNGISIVLDDCGDFLSIEAKERIIEASNGFPLASVIRGRTIVLKGMGNSIVPQVAAKFIKAFMEYK